jgi:uncharacterized protein DUF4440
MRRMHPTRQLSVIVALVACSNITSAQAPQRLRDGIHTFLTSQYVALAYGDTVTLDQTLADDLVWVVGANGGTLTKPQVIALAAHVQSPVPSFEIDSLDVALIGNVAIAEYRRTDHRDLASFHTRTTSRVLDVFRPHGTGWLLARHTQTWIVSAPASVTLDSTALDAFVGRYEIGPGFIDNVHWHDGHLVAQSSVESVGATLVPVSNSAFSPDGIAPLIVFERDATGRVTGYVQQDPDGTVRRAHRLPAAGTH